ncbi:MAG: NHL repeat containing protein [Bacteroidetes bacterium]|nr:MAG: NHL repeat containing protein [Bacteroidota bacterium]
MKKAILISLLIAGAYGVDGQTTLCNREWEAVNAFPDTVDFTMTAIDNSGCAVIVGNTKTISQGTNLLTVKYNSNGTICWQQQYNGTSNGPDFGSAIIRDNSGNIFVTGATWSNATSSYDFVTLKYSATGSLLWSVLYNGTGNKNDIAAAIALDNTGNVYITGASVGTGNALNSDFVTIKYNGAGMQQWVKRYNFANLPDIPFGLAVDNAGNSYVAGSSASSFFNSDITVIKYNTAGTQVGAYRHAISGNGYDKATAITLDNAGNVFVSGGTAQNTTAGNALVLKLNTALTLQWVQQYNGENLEDCANALALNANGDVIFTGYTKKTNGGKDFTTAKYSAAGIQQWVKREAAPSPTDFGEAHKLTVDNSGNVYVTGEMTNAAGNKDYLTIKYDSSGTKAWENFFNAPTNASDKSFDVSIRNSTMYVTGKSSTGNADQYATIKYSFLETALVVDTTSLPGMAFATGEVVVRFDPSVIDTPAVNDPDKQFGVLHEFVKPSAIAVMNAKLGTDVTDWKVAKIFLKLSTNDTVSISRLGDTVPISSFWAALRLFVQPGMEIAVADSLNTVQPEIWYAHPNYVAELADVPNDPQYISNQFSLHPNNPFPSAGINIEPAWDIEKGNATIRVGVYDSGIDQTHPDLQGKVAGGFNFITNAPLAPTYDLLGHGTACAGIIGALRDNSTGIAGIAGGNGTAQYDGVTLFDMKLFDANSAVATYSLIANGVVGGATSTTQGGYGLHIMNNSWRGDAGPLPAASISLLKDAVRFAARNNVVVVGARGNDGNSNITVPACYNDEFVLNVGSTGNDGEYKTPSNGSSSYSSSYGGGMDFCAPGDLDIVYTLESITNGYQPFDGTSAAAPHVSGTAALMVSKVNTQTTPFLFHLAPEDIEYLLQAAAVDLSVSPSAPGYDQYTGYGRINAGQSLTFVNYPAYKVYHFATNTTGSSVSPSLFAQNVAVILPNNYQSVAAGAYLADIHKVTHTLNYAPIPVGETILSAWPRYNSSFGWSLSNPIGTEAWSTIVSYTNNQAVMETYFYHFTFNLTTGQAVNTFLPTTQFGTLCAFSVLTFDPTLTGMTESASNAVNVGEPFPNPSNNSFSIPVSLSEASAVTVDLYDMQGRLVKSTNMGKLAEGMHTTTIETTDVSDGAYIATVTTEKGSIQKKMIVVHK